MVPRARRSFVRSPTIRLRGSVARVWPVTPSRGSNPRDPGGPGSVLAVGYTTKFGLKLHTPPCEVLGCERQLETCVRQPEASTSAYFRRARSGSLHRRRAGRRGHSRVPVQPTGVCFAPLHHAAHWPRHQLQCGKPLLAWPKQQSQSAEHGSGDSASMAAEPLIFGPEISILMLRCR